jgi:hypothetical protein
MRLAVWWRWSCCPTMVPASKAKLLGHPSPNPLVNAKRKSGTRASSWSARAPFLLPWMPHLPHLLLPWVPHLSPSAVLQSQRRIHCYPRLPNLLHFLRSRSPRLLVPLTLLPSPPLLVPFFPLPPRALVRRVIYYRRQPKHSILLLSQLVLLPHSHPPRHRRQNHLI